jgi:hypothetical protein
MQHVDMSPSQRSDLAETKAAECAEHHHRPILRFDGVGYLEHLGNRGNRSFRGSLDRGALDDARVARHEPIFNRGREVRVQQSVALRYRRRAGLAAAQHRGPPLPHPGRRELVHLRRAERRVDVVAQQAFVQLDRARPKLRSFTQPADRVVGH